MRIPLRLISTGTILLLHIMPPVERLILCFTRQLYSSVQHPFKKKSSNESLQSRGVKWTELFLWCLLSIIQKTWSFSPWPFLSFPPTKDTLEIGLTVIWKQWPWCCFLLLTLFFYTLKKKMLILMLSLSFSFSPSLTLRYWKKYPHDNGSRDCSHTINWKAILLIRGLAFCGDGL